MPACARVFPAVAPVILDIPDPLQEREKLSFFDDVDEPPTPPRTSTRSRRPPGGGRSSGGRRPPSGRGPSIDQQALRRRRLIAGGAIVVVIILIVVGIHSCQVSARNSALKNYTNHVSSLIQSSNANGTSLFRLLSGATASSNAQNLQNQVNTLRAQAQTELDSANNLSVPSEMTDAHRNFLLTMTMRRDGMSGVAREIEPALGGATSRDAINSIALDMASFYASDVVYKDYTTTKIAAALNAAGIKVGGTDGQPIEGGQFVPSLNWLQPAFITSQLGAHPSSSGGKVAPGLHGHSLDSVSVAGTTLQTGSTNTIPASPPPTFTLNLTNGGSNTETNVKCKVSVNGTSISGTKVIPQTTAGSSATCAVTLNQAPTPGTYTVTATVEPVPGEKSTSNNTLSFPVGFQ
jgi:hypothetical protein